MLPASSDKVFQSIYYSLGDISLCSCVININSLSFICVLVFCCRFVYFKFGLKLTKVKVEPAAFHLQ